MADSSVVIKALRTDISNIERDKAATDAIQKEIQVKSEERVQAVREGTVPSTTGKEGPRTVPSAIKLGLEADLAAQTANQKLAEAGNFEQFSLQQVKTIQEQSDIKQQKLARAQELNEGNILQQIYGIVAIPLLANEARQAGNRASSAASALEATNQVMQSSFKTTAAIQTRVNESTVKDTVKAVNADISAQALTLEIAALASNADKIKALQEMGSKQVHDEVKIYEIQKTEESLALQHAEAKARRDAIDKQALSDDAAFLLINKGRVANGQAPFREDQKAFVGEERHKPGPTGEALREYTYAGADIEGTGKIRHGSTPTEGIEYRRKTGYQPATVTQQQTLTEINSLSNSKPVQEASSVAAKTVAFNNAFLEKFNAEQEAIKGSNDFAKPATWGTLANSRAMKENPVWKSVIAPTITEGIATDYAEPKDVYNRVVAGVQNGMISPNEGAEFISLYAKYSMAMNNEASGIEMYTGYKQNRFIGKVEVPPTGALAFMTPDIVHGLLPAGTKNLDMLDSVKVRETITQTVANSIRKVPK